MEKLITTSLKKSPTILLNKNDFYKEIEQNYETLRSFIEKYLSKKIINPEYQPLEVMIQLRPKHYSSDNHYDPYDSENDISRQIDLVCKNTFNGKVCFHYKFMHSYTFVSIDNMDTDDLIDIANYFNHNEKDKK